MYLGVQPNLMERVAFESARRQPEIRIAYERQFADCYEYRDSARRDQAFAELHDRWFRELGYRAMFIKYAAAFPYVSRFVDRLMVTQASGARDQTVELFGEPGQYTVVMAVATAVMLDHPAFDYWARHELQHVDDMLNPSFEYDRTMKPKGATDGGRNLARDRYAVLWAVSVDARLEAAGHLPEDIRQKRYAELSRAFGFASAPSAVFDELWESIKTSSPSHPTLFKWSMHGPPGWEIGANRTNDQRNGSLCPLCGFPTFDWGNAEADDEDLYRTICADFPEWNPEKGLCNRCEEIYRACVPARVCAG